ncbi:SIR2 family protein [Shinella sp.]|uniref:SIR2 family protein n=1 Tax=Shinella sp. TaxID=1870904 RepID=UPI0029B2B8F7|nr:SIR2 family protein [Shinella sp.]MDX3976774.1 SIR2 family protein [Shinella sp.]
MVAWPEALVREIADRRAIIFVGAGLSKAARPAMPTWAELIIQLSVRLPKGVDKKLIKNLVNQNRLLDAAQIITDGIDRADLNNALRSTFQVRPAPIHDVYDKILQLDLKTVVTTNYDEFLEKNFDHHSGGNAAYNVCKHTSKDLLDQIRSPQRSIVKIHGCITETNNLVLDRMSYFKAKQENTGFFNVMSAIFTTHTILFLGYSIGDPDLQIILENTHAASNSSHGHYALLPKMEHRSMVKAIKQSYNISCIEYTTGNHALVPSAIEELQRAVDAVRAGRGIG